MKSATDMDMDVAYDERLARFADRRTQQAWLLWNKALETRDAKAEPEPPIEVDLDGIHIADFNLYFDWGQAKCGFGQLHISKHEDGTVGCMNESMSRRWVRRAVHAAVDVLVDNAKLED